MNKKIVKKIIVREGLAVFKFIAVALIGVLLAFGSRFIYMDIGYIIAVIGNILFWGAIFSYPVYLLIRFILWAIRTLREK